MYFHCIGNCTLIHLNIIHEIMGTGKEELIVIHFSHYSRRMYEKVIKVEGYNSNGPHAQNLKLKSRIP